MTERTAETLTEREREVARLMAAGLTNAEIAERLGITFATAKWHVSQVLGKLEVTSREELPVRSEAADRPVSRGRRVRKALGVGLFVKPLGVAAAVVPVGLVGVATVVVLLHRGDNSQTPRFAARAVVAENTTVVSPPPADRTPPPQPHTCDWQVAQAHLNDGPIDHRGCDFSGVNFGERGMMWNMAILADSNLSGAVISGTFARADFRTRIFAERVSSSRCSGRRISAVRTSPERTSRTAS